MHKFTIDLSYNVHLDVGFFFSEKEPKFFTKCLVMFVNSQHSRRELEVSILLLNFKRLESQFPHAYYASGTRVMLSCYFLFICMLLSFNV